MWTDRRRDKATTICFPFREHKHDVKNNISNKTVIKGGLPRPSKTDKSASLSIFLRMILTHHISAELSYYINYKCNDKNYITHILWNGLSATLININTSLLI